MFSMRLRRIHSYLFSAILLALMLAMSYILLLNPQLAGAGDPPPPDTYCSISVYTSSTAATVTFSASSSQSYPRFGVDYYEVRRDTGGWITVAGNSHTYYGLTPGSTHTYYGRATWIVIPSQGAPAYRETKSCGSRTATQDNPNNPAYGSVIGSCSAAGRLDVHITVSDADGGTPGFSMHIDNVGDFGMDYGGTGWRGAWYPPRNGITYSIWIHVVDPQTGGVYGPFYGNYTCPPPPTPPTCSLSVNPALVPPSSTSTLTWSSTNATTFTVDQGVGSLTPVAAGSTTVSPGLTSKTYTGTVTGPGGSANCSTTLTVGNISCTLNSILAIEPGDTYTPNVTLNYVGGAATVSATITIIVTGNPPPSSVVVPPTAVPGNISLTFSTSPTITFPTAGNFTVATKTVSGTVNGIAYGPVTCGGATVVPVVVKPYFKVFNGGATVGAGFNSGTTTCSAVATGQVSAFASSTPSLHGASTQYDLKALNTVAQTFYSSGVNPGGVPSFKALTFANNAASGTYGGSLGGSSCITDYYTTTKNDSVPTASGAASIASLDTAASTGNQVEWGGGTLSGGSLSAGGKLVVYVDGDVYITNNITLASNYPGGITDIPFFALVVRGNIMIAPGVSTLDGLYIAQPKTDGTKGTIFTCATSISTIPASTALYDVCNDFKLTFNGSVVAKSMKLLRTIGTLRNGPANETAASANIAEVFNGMPELFIANPAFKVDESTSGLYDSITSLPPLL